MSPCTQSDKEQLAGAAQGEEQEQLARPAGESGRHQGFTGGRLGKVETESSHGAAGESAAQGLAGAAREGEQEELAGPARGGEKEQLAGAAVESAGRHRLVR